MEKVLQLLGNSSEEPPHWMASLQHLTEETTNNHRLPFVQQFPFHAPPTWGTAGLTPVGPSGVHAPPPPGFHTTQIHPTTQLPTETQQLATAEGLQ
ncbi:hypothetical protein LSAT2_002041 [Lamellibrachia satsuma]|nr:hypothetical protein LSAT2_002041 [Lamellibrachia satsuma]